MQIIRIDDGITHITATDHRHRLFIFIVCGLWLQSEIRLFQFPPRLTFVTSTQESLIGDYASTTFVRTTRSKK
jgi:hypothetical protein